MRFAIGAKGDAFLALCADDLVKLDAELRRLQRVGVLSFDYTPNLLYLLDMTETQRRVVQGMAEYQAAV